MALLAPVVLKVDLCVVEQAGTGATLNQTDGMDEEERRSWLRHRLGPLPYHAG
jgi:hypothetical protein